MLTADLVRARSKDGKLILSKFRGDARSRATEIAEQYLTIAGQSIGSTRGELEEALRDVPVGARDQKVASGLEKLVLDRCEFEIDAGLDPAELRAEVFRRASAAREAGTFDRDAVIAEVASDVARGPEEVERLLYADIRQNHAVLSFTGVDAAQLVAQYEEAQAQAVLLRAEKVVAQVKSANPATYRYLFRKLKFLRLLHQITPQEDGYRITVDGPFSLFSSVTKYGLQLALLLPALRACDEWALQATVRWGKDRRRLEFEASGGRGPNEEAVAALPDEVQTLFDKLAKRKGPWRVSRAGEILDLPGVGVCIPDLVFEHEKNGTRVYLEVLGFWSRDAVWKRIELVERGLDVPIVFAVPKRLRVSEEALPDDLPAALYVYKGVMSAKAIEERLAAAVRG